MSIPCRNRHGDGNTQLFQIFQYPNDIIGFADRGAFGDLKLQILRVQLRFSKSARHGRRNQNSEVQDRTLTATRISAGLSNAMSGIAGGCHQHQSPMGANQTVRSARINRQEKRRRTPDGTNGGVPQRR